MLPPTSFHLESLSFNGREMQASGCSPSGNAQREGLRRLPEDRRFLGPPALVHDLRARRLLRQFEEQARHETFPRHHPSDHEIPSAWRAVGMVLCGRDLPSVLEKHLPRRLRTGVTLRMKSRCKYPPYG